MTMMLIIMIIMISYGFCCHTNVFCAVNELPIKVAWLEYTITRRETERLLAEKTKETWWNIGGQRGGV